MKHPMYDNPHFRKLSQERRKQIAFHYMKNGIPLDETDVYATYQYLHARLLAIYRNPEIAFVCDMCFQQGDHEDPVDVSSCDCGYGSFAPRHVALDILCEERQKAVIALLDLDIPIQFLQVICPHCGKATPWPSDSCATCEKCNSEFIVYFGSTVDQLSYHKLTHREWITEHVIPTIKIEGQDE